MITLQFTDTDGLIEFVRSLDGYGLTVESDSNVLYMRLSEILHDRASPVGDATPASEGEWRYEFRPDEKYPDLGIYTILAPNPDAGKEGVVYSGAEVAIADTDDKESAAQIVREHNAHRKLVEALQAAVHAMRSYQYGNASPDLAEEVAACAYAAILLAGRP